MVIQQSNKKLVLIGLLLGLIFSELDQTIVSTALPTIIRDLHGLSLFGWVAGIYMLAITIFMPLFGKLADLYGHKRIYMICMALFIAGSIICGFAGSMIMLLAGRCIQGIGAGGLMPLAMIIIGDIFPLEQRAKIQSTVGPLLILPQLIGPVMGGYFVSHVNWHWIFLVNIPVGLFAAFLVFRSLHLPIRTERKAIDWAGALTITLAILSLLLAPVLIDIQSLSWSSPVVLGLLALSAVLIALFIWIESKAEEPIIPLRLFRNRSVVVLSVIVFLTMLGIMGGTSALPFFAQNVMGLTPTASGYLNLGFMAGAIPVSILCGFLITRIAYKYLFIASFLFPIGSYFMLSRISVDVTVIYILVAFFILGLGIGVLFGSDNLIVQESVDKEHSGVGLATVQLFQSLGATLGFSIFGSLLSKGIGDGIAGLSDHIPDAMKASIMNGGIPSELPAEMVLKVKTVYADAFQMIFTISISFAVVTFLVCWLLKNEVLSSKEQVPASNVSVGPGT
ncbi:MDR family MFS transporter [Paenibacillus allorhizosphaerae]|uniref:Multidrug resistance protein 3 n=1 Tax=Paenibacillus allorhizosphaerae TaxID=2849866 RepID=A0ABN7TT45_9BACL|nr:MDR family MFS transporter [Paenibacillus allorhizosphaerae]CAG7654792.1 Multidrug resistance protein 3 [Paenibacillus allorhizosphaerae]